MSKLRDVTLVFTMSEERGDASADKLLLASLEEARRYLGDGWVAKLMGVPDAGKAELVLGAVMLRWATEHYDPEPKHEGVRGTV